MERLTALLTIVCADEEYLKRMKAALRWRDCTVAIDSDETNDRESKSPCLLIQLPMDSDGQRVLTRMRDFIREEQKKTLFVLEIRGHATQFTVGDWSPESERDGVSRRIDDWGLRLIND